MRRRRIVTAAAARARSSPLWLSWPAAALLALIAGCGSIGDPSRPRTFLVQLDPGAAGAHAQRTLAATVYVAPAVVTAPFSGRGLVVRQTELGFTSDPYAEFAANPVSMWTDAVRDWLDERQVFEHVLPSDSSAEASLTLETRLIEAVVDRRAGQAAASRVTVRFLLIQNAQPYHVLLDRTFSRAEAVSGSGPEREVAALSLAFEHALHDLEEAVARIPD
jgi:ABC-type uncharacterized transport system auxiliary subunit